MVIHAKVHSIKIYDVQKITGFLPFLEPKYVNVLASVYDMYVDVPEDKASNHNFEYAQIII